MQNTSKLEQNRSSYTPNKNETNNNLMNKYTAFVLKQLEKLIIKSMYQQFFSNLRTHVFYQVKQTNKPLWKYQKLFSKSNPSIQQLKFKQFLNHCAITIQSSFKRFINQRQYRTTKRIYNNLTKWVIAKKVRNTYNCKKIKDLRMRIIQVEKAIDKAFTQNKSATGLFKQKKFLEVSFNQQFEFLYQSGGWIYQQYPKSKKYYTSNFKRPTQFKQQPINKKQYDSLNSNNQFYDQPTFDPIPNQSIVQSQYYSKDVQKIQTIKNKHQFSLNTDVSQRPIKSTGAYNLSMQQSSIPTNFSKNQQPLQTLQVPSQPKHKRTTKKQVYNPMKAVQQAKKKQRQLLKAKKQTQKIKQKQMNQQQHQIQLKVPNKIQITQIHQQNTIRKIDQYLEKSPIAQRKTFKQGLKNRREKHQRHPQNLDKSIESKSNTKQGKSRIDCWNRSAIELKKKKSIQQAYTKKLQQNQFEYIPQPKDISRHELNAKMRKNLQKIDQIQKYHNQRQRQKQKFLTLDDIESTYSKNYLNRYNKIRPKLDQLLLMRANQHVGPIPYIVNESIYGINATQSIFNQQYYQMQTDIIKDYRKLQMEQ